MNTRYFTVELGPNAGTYCSYCGTKIIPGRDPGGDGLEFTCPCETAKTERKLRYDIVAAEDELYAWERSLNEEDLQLLEIRVREVAHRAAADEFHNQAQEIETKRATAAKLMKDI
jgi:hypothetical protein